MGLGTEQTTDRGIAALVGRMADGFSRLVSQHIELARAELAQDVRGMGMDVASIAVFVPFVLVGYLFVCGALAALLAQWLGWAGALGLVGGANLVGGGIGIYGAITRLRTRGVMNQTSQELNRSVEALTNLPAVAQAPVAPGPQATQNVMKVPQAPQVAPAPAGANVLQPQAAAGKNVIKEQPHGR
jgi:hypothetical protein